MSETNSPNGPPELYLKYRPQTFKDLVGQQDAVTTLMGMGRSGTLPHALLLTGPSGVGKTTAARIIAKNLEIDPQDLYEKNSAEARGIDDIRAIQGELGLYAKGKKNRKMYILDEVHKVTNDAQNALLKTLEDTPSHVYFILCSSEPNKIIKAIQTRCTAINFKPVSQLVLKSLVLKVVAAEGKTIGDNVADKIAEYSFASPRQALVLLHKVINLPDDVTRLAVLEKPEMHANGFEIAKAILGKKGWPAVSKLLKESEDEDEEGIRRVILGYFRSVLMNNGDDRVWNLMLCFRAPTYEWGPGAERHGLVTCCYEAVTQV